MTAGRLVLAATALAGCAIAVKSLTVPYAEFCDAAQSCPFDNRLPTLLNDVNDGVSPLAVVTIAAIAVAAVAAIALVFVRSGRAAVTATVSLNAAALLALGVFAYLHMGNEGGRWGALIGILGASLILFAGLGTAFTFPERNPHSRLTVR